MYRPLTAGELGQLADLYDEARKSRLAADKESAKHREVEYGAEQLLIEQMRTQRISAAGGATLRVGLEGPDYVPRVENWQSFYQYIQESGDFSLLERRPGKLACRERWEAGMAVPGVEKFPVYKLSRQGV
jgi:hypothetical protein